MDFGVYQPEILDKKNHFSKLRKKHTKNGKLLIVKRCFEVQNSQNLTHFFHLRISNYDTF